MKTPNPCKYCGSAPHQHEDCHYVGDWHFSVHCDACPQEPSVTARESVAGPEYADAAIDEWNQFFGRGLAKAGEIA